MISGLFRFLGVLMALSWLLVCISVPAIAEDRTNPFYKACNSYKSSKDYVKQSSYFCVKQRRSKDCAKAAKAYFELCEFEGDFVRISKQIHTDMLFMFVLVKAPSVPISSDSKK